MTTFSKVRFTAVATAVLALGFALPVFAQKARRITPPKKFPIGGSAPSGANLKVPNDLSQRLARWRPVDMPFRTQGLSAREVRLIDKLVEASRALEGIYRRQSDSAAITLEAQLKGSRAPRDQQILRFIQINGSRYDLLDENRPFAGTDPALPGRDLYPPSVTRQQIEEYVQAHPEKRAELYSPYTVVRRMGDELIGVPYHIAYRAPIAAAATSLREAAALSDDPAFADFLKARADALQSDDYYASDVKWLDLKSPKIDVIFAPYEVYLDGLLGVKASYGAAVMIRNDAESRKLEIFQQYLPQIQQSLPLAAENKPNNEGHNSPMEVVDSPYRAGDLLHGYQVVADNLPNDPKIHAEKGTKKIFFKNFMDARVKYVVLPIAQKLMDTSQSKQVSGDAYLTTVIMHEICHGLGPAYARANGSQRSIAEAIGPLYSPLEEAKADVTGMYALRWLTEHGAMPKEQMPAFYASYLAGILRSVRFGVAEAHGRAQMMEFNYLLEKGAITPRAGTLSRGTASTVFAMNYDKLPAAIDALSKELLEIEATGERKRAEDWFSKYANMPSMLQSALASTKTIPVDFFPRFSFPEKPIQ